MRFNDYLVVIFKYSVTLAMPDSYRIKYRI